MIFNCKKFMLISFLSLLSLPLLAKDKWALGGSIGSPTATLQLVAPAGTVSFNWEVGFSYMGLDHTGMGLFIIIPSFFTALDIYVWEGKVGENIEMFIGFGARYLLTPPLSTRGLDLFGSLNNTHLIGPRFPIGFNFKVNEGFSIVLKGAPGVSFGIPTKRDGIIWSKRPIPFRTNFSLDLGLSFLKVF